VRRRIPPPHVGGYKPSRPKVIVRTLHEPGRADLPVSLDAQQRVPTRFMVPMRDSGIVEASMNRSAGFHLGAPSRSMAQMRVQCWKSTLPRILGRR